MIALAVLVSILTGLALVLAIWPGRDLWIRLGLAIPLGLAISSIPAHLNPGNAVLIDLTLLAILSLCAALRFRAIRSEEAPPAGQVWAPAQWTALALCGITCLSLFYRYRTDPHGDFEAWRVWNMRARFVFRGGTVPAEVTWLHPEAPYQLTAGVVRTWRWNGAESLSGPALLSAAFALSVPLLLFGTLRRLRTASQACLASAAIFGSTAFFAQATTLGADIPLAALLFAAFAAIFLESAGDFPTALLGGLCAGFAPWTKQEGFYYTAALAATYFWRRKPAGFAAFVLGLLPGLGVALYYFLVQAPANPTLTGANPVALITALGGRLFLMSFMGWIVTPIAVLAVYAWCLGPSAEKQRARQSWIATAMLFASGFLAVVVRDNNPGDSAGLRLFLHVWPALLLSLFLWARTPEEVRESVADPRAKRKRK